MAEADILIAPASDGASIANGRSRLGAHDDGNGIVLAEGLPQTAAAAQDRRPNDGSCRDQTLTVRRDDRPPHLRTGPSVTVGRATVHRPIGES